MKKYLHFELPIKSLGRYGLDSDTLKVLQDIRTNVGNNNPLLQELSNLQNLQKEESRVGSTYVLVEEGRTFLAGKIGGILKTGIPIPGLTNGDGIIPAEPNLPHAKKYFIRGNPHHKKLANNGISSNGRLLDGHKLLKLDELVWAIIAYELTGAPVPERFNPKERIRIKPPTSLRDQRKVRLTEAKALLWIGTAYLIGTGIVAAGISHALSGWPKNKGRFPLIEYGKNDIPA